MSTALTRMPCGPNSFDNALVNASPAALETDVGVDPRSGSLGRYGQGVHHGTAPHREHGEGETSETYRSHDLEGQIVFPDLIIAVRQTTGGGSPGVVHYGIDAAPTRRCGLDEANQVIDFGHVACHPDDVTTKRLQRLHGVVDLLLGASAERNLGPFGHQPLAECAAKTF